jgi:hypothetical protein
MVYQQQVLSQDGLQRVAVGHQQLQVALQELWVSPPAPGTYYVNVSACNSCQLSNKCCTQLRCIAGAMFTQSCCKAARHESTGAPCFLHVRGCLQACMM